MVQHLRNKMHWEFYLEKETGVQSKFVFSSYSWKGSRLHPFKLVQLGLESVELKVYFRWCMSWTCHVFVVYYTLFHAGELCTWWTLCHLRKLFLSILLMVFGLCSCNDHFLVCFHKCQGRIISPSLLLSQKRKRIWCRKYVYSYTRELARIELCDGWAPPFDCLQTDHSNVQIAARCASSSPQMLPLMPTLVDFVTLIQFVCMYFALWNVDQLHVVLFLFNLTKQI